MRLTLQQGNFLVKTARYIIDLHVKYRKTEEIEFPSWCSIKRGVFVTIETYPERELRGCIGYPIPARSLKENLIECAIEACHDPRFKDLTENELNRIIVEVSVLTIPEKIDYNNVNELLEKIQPRKDGIILRYGFFSSLFLPQVWKKIPEKSHFLSNLCLKAGLPPDTWKNQNIDFFKFNVQAFREKEPYGDVEEVEL
jgi:hypothetical protein